MGTHIASDNGVNGGHVVLAGTIEGHPDPCSDGQQNTRVEHIHQSINAGFGTRLRILLDEQTSHGEAKHPADDEGQVDIRPANEKRCRGKQCDEYRDKAEAEGVFIACLPLLGRCMVVRVLAVVDGGAVTVAANGCGAVAYLLVGVVYAVAIAVDGADAELLSGISGSGVAAAFLASLRAAPSFTQAVAVPAMAVIGGAAAPIMDRTSSKDNLFSL